MVDGSAVRDLYLDVGAIALGLLAVMIGLIVLVALVDRCRFPADRKLSSSGSTRGNNAQPRRPELTRSSSFRRWKSMHRPLR